MYVETVPVVPAKGSQKPPISKLVREILADPGSPEITRHLEADITKLVYALYGLAPEEIEIVEGKRRSV